MVSGPNSFSNLALSWYIYGNFLVSYFGRGGFILEINRELFFRKNYGPEKKGNSSCTQHHLGSDGEMGWGVVKKRPSS